MTVSTETHVKTLACSIISSATRWAARDFDSARAFCAIARRVAGLMLGLAGLVLVVEHKLGLGEVTAFYFASCVVALLAITVGTLHQKRFVRAADVRTANAVQLMAALVVTLPLALLEPGVCASPIGGLTLSRSGQQMSRKGGQ